MLTEKVKLTHVYDRFSCDQFKMRALEKGDYDKGALIIAISLSYIENRNI